ncbi:MAG: PAS domain S-box protein [Pseudomonadota bacterium]
MASELTYQNTFSAFERVVDTLLYAAPFFVVRRADRILAGQQREIERHVAALESSEQRLARTRFAVDNASEMVVWLDRDGRFLYANEAALAAIGCSRDELGGLSILDVDATLDAAAWEARWSDSAARRRAPGRPLPQPQRRGNPRGRHHDAGRIRRLRIRLPVRPRHERAPAHGTGPARP